MSKRSSEDKDVDIVLNSGRIDRVTVRAGESKTAKANARHGEGNWQAIVDTKATYEPGGNESGSVTGDLR